MNYRNIILSYDKIDNMIKSIIKYKNSSLSVMCHHVRNSAIGNKF